MLINSTVTSLHGQRFLLIISKFLRWRIIVIFVIHDDFYSFEFIYICSWAKVLDLYIVDYVIEWWKCFISCIISQLCLFLSSQNQSMFVLFFPLRELRILTVLNNFNAPRKSARNDISMRRHILFSYCFRIFLFFCDYHWWRFSIIVMFVCISKSYRMARGDL